jgi:Uma2 family endonuclease
MASPSVRHQRLSWELSGMIYDYLKEKPCKAFTAPFDVRLFPKADNSDTTVVRPDIIVVCDPSKLVDGKACKGAPDLIIEIISESSVIIDRIVMAAKYQEAGVKEYWIVNAISEVPEIMVNVLSDKRYIATVYKDRAQSSIFPGLEVDINTIMEKTV